MKDIKIMKFVDFDPSPTTQQRNFIKRFTKLVPPNTDIIFFMNNAITYNFDLNKEQFAKATNGTGKKSDIKILENCTVNWSKQSVTITFK